MQHDHVLKKFDFDLRTPNPGLGGGGNHFAAFVILFNFNMQHDYVQKKLNCDLLTPYPGFGGGGSASKVFAAMLLHL